MASSKANDKKPSADFSLSHASDWLGVATWQFEAAVRRELIPSADRCGRWSAAVLEATAERLAEILAQVGEQPPIGANRASQRLGQRLDLDIERADVEVLVERNLLASLDRQSRCDRVKFGARGSDPMGVAWIVLAPQRNDSAPDLHIRASRHGQHI